MTNVEVVETILVLEKLKDVVRNNSSALGMLSGVIERLKVDAEDPMKPPEVVVEAPRVEKRVEKKERMVHKAVKKRR